MKKIIVSVICFLTLGIFSTVSFAENAMESFEKMHLEVLKQMYHINNYLYTHHQNAKDLAASPDFEELVLASFTPDSYNALVDENTTYYLHPNKSIIGKKLTDLKDTNAALIVLKSIKDDSCTSGFYTWIDGQKKYMIVCPLSGTTKDGHKFYYFYTVYQRSIPDSYVKVLKKSVDIDK